MKTSTTTLIAFFAAFLLLIGTQGCYTQLGSTRDEEAYTNDNDTEAVAEDEAAGEEYVDDAGRNPDSLTPGSAFARSIVHDR